MSAGNTAERKQSGRLVERVKDAVLVREPTRTWYRVVHSKHCSWPAPSADAGPGQQLWGHGHICLEALEISCDKFPAAE